MNSADPERRGDAALPVRFGPAADLTAARRDLAAELAQHLPSRTEREVMLAALREVWALAERWARGDDVGQGAAASIRAAISGQPGPAPWARHQQAAQLAVDQCGAGLLYEPDAPFRSGGVRPGE